MAINTLVTRGYGNGTYSGTIALLATRGYAIGAAIIVAADPEDTVIAQAGNRIIIVDDTLIAVAQDTTRIAQAQRTLAARTVKANA